MRQLLVIAVAACAADRVCEAPPGAADAPPLPAVDAPPAPDADTSDRDRCLAIIGGLVPAPELDTVLVYVPPGWSIAAGPWSRFNQDLAVVQDVFRYEGLVGALTIFLHDGVVTCVYREEVPPP